MYNVKFKMNMHRHSLVGCDGAKVVVSIGSRKNKITGNSREIHGKFTGGAYLPLFL